MSYRWVLGLAVFLVVGLGAPRDLMALSECRVFQRGVDGTVDDALINIISKEQCSSEGAFSNFGSSNSLAATYGTAGVRNALLRFELSGIPKNAQVKSATMTLTVILYGGVKVQVHRITAPPGTTTWKESTVTWHSFWSSFADDAEFFTLPVAGNNQASSVNVKPLVQAWLDYASTGGKSGSPNYGVLLERNNISGATVFASSELTFPGKPNIHPKLEVCYEY